MRVLIPTSEEQKSLKAQEFESQTLEKRKNFLR